MEVTWLAHDEIPFSVGAGDLKLAGFTLQSLGDIVGCYGVIQFHIHRDDPPSGLLVVGLSPP
jgi:hypothetical protein